MNESLQSIIIRKNFMDIIKTINELNLSDQKIEDFYLQYEKLHTCVYKTYCVDMINKKIKSLNNYKDSRAFCKTFRNEFHLLYQKLYKLFNTIKEELITVIPELNNNYLHNIQCISNLISEFSNNYSHAIRCEHMIIYLNKRDIG